MIIDSLCHLSYKDNTENRTTPHTDQQHRGNKNSGTNYTKGRNHSHYLNTNHNHGTHSQSNGGTHHSQQVDTSGAHSHGGGKHDHSWNNEPEYYVLAFIIKISDT